MMWSTVGSVLLLVGGWWAFHPPEAWLALPLLPAIALGLFKSRLVLDRAADRIARRILDRGDGRCIGGFLSPASWLLVVLMAGGGRLLRSGPIPRFWIGLLYAGVGAGLFRSSLVFWKFSRKQSFDRE